MVKNCFCFFFLLVQVVLYGQFFSSSVDCSSEQEIIEKLSGESGEVKTIPELTAQLQAQFALSPTLKAESKEIITWVFLAKQLSSIKGKENTLSTQFFKSALEKVKKTDQQALRIWISSEYGYYLYTYRKYQESYAYFSYCIQNLDKTPDEKIINISETYKKIAYFLSTSGDQEKSIQYLLKADQYAVSGSKNKGSILDALGMAYLKLNNIPMAENYIKQAIETSLKNNDQLRYAKALGNLADVNGQRKNYETAIALLTKDIRISKELKSDQNTMYALIMKSRFHFENNEIDAAEMHIKEAEKIAAANPYFKSSDYEINRLILKIAKQKKDAAGELTARRNLERLKDSLEDLDGEETILRVNWEIEKNKLVEIAASEKRQKTTESYLKTAAVSLCVLLGLLMIFNLRSYRKKIKKEKMQYRATLKDLNKDKMASEHKLVKTNETLQSYLVYLSEKNEQIDRLSSEIAKIKNSSASYLEKDSGELQKLLESHLMTEEKWSSFKAAYIKEYHADYKRVMDNYPDLTDSNLRIIILTRLGMTHTEMSNILGVTTDAVKKAKQRLRKKYSPESGEENIV